MNHTDHLRKGEDVNVITSLISGSVSGLVARFGTAPMDMIKIRLQIMPLKDKLHGKGGAIEMIKGILHREGLRGLWKGNVPGSIMYVVYGGVQFGTYSFYNNALSPLGWSGQLHSLIVGALAGMSSSLTSYPFDVLRTRFVANRNQELSRLQGAIVQIWREDGVQGFFKGCWSSMVTITLATSIMFGTYESIRIYCDRLEEQESRWWLRTLNNSSSAIGGVVSKLATFPLDTIRRRMVLSNSSSIHTLTEHTDVYKGYHRQGIVRIGLQILEQEGIAALYKGVTMALCKSVPSTAISLWVYERCMVLAGRVT